MMSVAHASESVIGNAPGLAAIALSILQFVLTLVGVVAMIGILFGTVLYFTSGGDETKTRTATRAINVSSIGLIVALVSLVLVNQFGAVVG